MKHTTKILALRLFFCDLHIYYYFLRNCMLFYTNSIFQTRLSIQRNNLLTIKTKQISPIIYQDENKEQLFSKKQTITISIDARNHGIFFFLELFLDLEQLVSPPQHHHVLSYQLVRDND